MFRKLFLACATSLLAYSQISAFCCSFLPEVAESVLEVGTGYRQDRISWKTHHFGVNTKTKWNNLKIWEINIAGKYVTCDDVYFRGYADYGWVTSGHASETDTTFSSFSFDDNGLLSGNNGFSGNDNFANGGYSSSRKNKAKGQVYDVSLALGYQFRWCDESLAFSPLIGYSWHGQHVSGREHYGYGSYSKDSSYGSYSDYSYSDYSDYSSYSAESFANSSDSYSYGSNRHKYHARWNGPWLGFDLEYAIWCDWTVFFDYEYHWAQYHASLNRPLFADINKSHHSGNNAHGQRFVLGTNWDFCNNWTVGLIGEYSFWKAQSGHERTNILDVSAEGVDVEVILKSRLKDVTWQTAAITVELGYAF